MGIGQSGIRINLKDTSLHAHIPFRYRSLTGHPIFEPTKTGFDIAAEHGFPGAGHSEVRLVGATPAEDSAICSRHMGMGAVNYGDPAIEVPAHRFFF